MLFWAMIMPLLQDTKNSQTALFGLKSLNQLIENDSSHDQIIGIGRATILQNQQIVQGMIQRAVKKDRNGETRFHERSETADREKDE